MGYVQYMFLFAFVCASAYVWIVCFCLMHWFFCKAEKCVESKTSFPTGTIKCIIAFSLILITIPDLYLDPVYTRFTRKHKRFFFALLGLHDNGGGKKSTFTVHWDTGRTETAVVWMPEEVETQNTMDVKHVSTESFIWTDDEVESLRVSLPSLLLSSGSCMAIRRKV